MGTHRGQHPTPSASPSSSCGWPAYLCRDDAETHSVLLLQGHGDDLGLLPQGLSLKDEHGLFQGDSGGGTRCPVRILL